jgi:hypothetical protein
MKKNGTSKDMNCGGSEEQDWLNRVRLPPLGNDNTGNCEAKMMSRGNLDEGVKGSAEICGGEGKAQMFNMGWMKNG